MNFLYCKLFTILLILTPLQGNGDPDSRMMESEEITSSTPRIRKRDRLLRYLLDTGCTYQCDTEGEVLVPNLNFTTTKNGCGASGVNRVINRLLPVKELRDCCDQHDSCYGTCGANKEECEDDFIDCLKKTCTERYQGVRKTKRYRDELKECYMVGKGFHAFTSFLSCSYFKKAQKEACLCVHPEQQLERQQQLVN